MENSRQKFCRLCLNKVDENYKAIEVTNDVLDILLLKLDLNCDKREVLCTACSVKLQAALNFKSTCFDTDNTITLLRLQDTCSVGSYGTSPVDLNEIYIRLKDEKSLVSLHKDQKVCRLCLQLVRDTFKTVDEVGKESFQSLIPEVDFTLTINPIICKFCCDSFDAYSNFAKSCLDAEKRPNHAQDDTKTDEQVFSVDSLKTEDIQMEYGTEEDDTGEHQEIYEKYGDMEEPLLIKTESIEIKSEIEDEDEEEYIQLSDLLPPNKNEHTVTCDADCNDKQLQYCTLCGYKTAFPHELISHTNIYHKVSSETCWYRCDLCSYKTEREEALNIHLKIHMLTHKDHSRLGLNKRDLCDFFKTKCSNSFKVHTTRMHAPPLEIRWHRCHLCNFKTMRWENLKEHIVRHSPNGKYDCKLCNEQFQEPENWMVHFNKIHKKNPVILLRRIDRETNTGYNFSISRVDELKMYKCSLCDFKHKWKSRVKEHMRIHRIFCSEIDWFNCNMCNYKTTIKCDFQKHIIRHKDQSEARWYYCDLCSYKNKCKQQLRKHRDVHCDLKNDRHKCDVCDYKSKHKSNVLRHMMLHKNPSEIQWYECDACDYKAKKKGTLEDHVAHMHKLYSEIQWHRCSLCDFKSKYSCSLMRHNKMRHNDSKIVQHKC